ncbi:MAG: bifunctional 4-hydroxy-2-oxoglutarate aldolase/2-dehydro-3-deoxy-phosphogluconate aldolase [Firmicutes bacterium]|nr:bifunctional 4-hydroxy-2-oxoglutarate aldolase/2-dehydro-3-deoxy-phosphogluconate aldolase [Bacillota bacterium]
MDDVSRRIYETGVIPVIKLNHPQETAQKLAEVLCCGGLPAAEVTFRAEGASEAIRLMRQARPDLLVGAGTVLSCGQAREAMDAGAQFIVMPGMDEEIVRFCREKGMPVFPGCSSATDYHTAYRLGLEVLKFFPAETLGGLSRIRALAGPFPMFRIMPTGGINLDNLEAYLSDPRIFACGGSYMVKESLIDGGCWDEIRSLCEHSADIVRKVRGEKTCQE